MIEFITDDEALAILAIHALNELYVQGECCPECCWPCEALRRLSERPDGPGSLTSILNHAPLDMEVHMWADGESTPREWLAARWTRTECHLPELEEEKPGVVDE